jgi:AcrR family transcriptional regulator
MSVALKEPSVAAEPGHESDMGEMVATSRQNKKAATRDRVILAARDKFLTLGFERTTIRDIARAAGVASGTVSGQYGSKMGLFSAVLRDEHEASWQVMRDADDPALSTRQRLNTVFRALFAYHYPGLDLMRAAILASWQPHGIADPANRAALTQIHGFLCDILTADPKVGRAKDDPLVSICAQNLIELYISGYQRSIFAGWSEEKAADRFETVIDIALNGLQRA